MPEGNFNQGAVVELSPDAPITFRPLPWTVANSYQATIDVGLLQRLVPNKVWTAAAEELVSLLCAPMHDPNGR